MPGSAGVLTPQRMVLLGPPGAGKGTQATWLSQATGAIHLSTGDLVREEITGATPIGKNVKQYSDRGELVPDQLIVDLVMPHLTKADCWILDGFPRDVAQARILDTALAELHIQIDCILALQVPDQLLVDRLQFRRASVATGKIYNLHSDPPDQADPGPFNQRTDDQPEEIRRRLQVYHEMTEPLLAYYANRSTLHRVDASGSIEVTHRLVLDALAR